MPGYFSHIYSGQVVEHVKMIGLTVQRTVKEVNEDMSFVQNCSDLIKIYTKHFYLKYQNYRKNLHTHTYAHIHTHTHTYSFERR